jgi:predicted S18 family serine protease
VKNLGLLNRIAELEAALTTAIQARQEAERAREEAEHLSDLACKARDSYDEERREAYQQMCGWKGRAEKAESILTAAEQARAQAEQQETRARLVKYKGGL